MCEPENTALVLNTLDWQVEALDHALPGSHGQRPLKHAFGDVHVNELTVCWLWLADGDFFRLFLHTNVNLDPFSHVIVLLYKSCLMLSVNHNNCCHDRDGADML